MHEPSQDVGGLRQRCSRCRRRGRAGVFAHDRGFSRISGRALEGPCGEVQRWHSANGDAPGAARRLPFPVHRPETEEDRRHWTDYRLYDAPDWGLLSGLDRRREPGVAGLQLLVLGRLARRGRADIALDVRILRDVEKTTEVLGVARQEGTTATAGTESRGRSTVNAHPRPGKFRA